MGPPHPERRLSTNLQGLIRGDIHPDPLTHLPGARVPNAAGLRLRLPRDGVPVPTEGARCGGAAGHGSDSLRGFAFSPGPEWP